jgi:outer membrane protein
MQKTNFLNRFVWALVAGLMLLGGGPGRAAELPPESDTTAEALTLEQTIKTGLDVNLALKISQSETMAAQSTRNAQRTNFWPTFSASYQYRRYYEQQQDPIFGVTVPENEYSFVTTVTQPIFTGFAILNQYKIANLGLDIAQIQETLARQDIVSEANNVYFSVLKAQKLLEIARQTVDQIKAQEDVARNYYEVGMTPLNELLQSQVELANAQQDLIIAYNNLETAKANFNTFLRRPINAAVKITDILDYTPEARTLDQCQQMAAANRLELQVADMELEIANREVELAKGDYYPSVSLQGNYYMLGTDYYVNGGLGIQDPNSWDVRATATWDFWQWGRSSHQVKAKLSRQSQAEYKKSKTQDEISLQVKQAYFKTLEAEKNIVTVEKAIELAKENFRINEERFKEQVATATDVLIAQTLLARTMTNYYNALYDFKIAKAFLYRAMGQELME